MPQVKRPPKGEKPSPPSAPPAVINKELTRAERKAARAARKANKVKRNVVGSPKDDGKDDEGNPKQHRWRKSGGQVCGELFITGEGDTIRAYMDWHDGSSPKTVEVKKGDYLRIRLSIEV